MAKKDALRGEAEGATIEFEFRGETYTLPASLNEADGEFLEYFEQNMHVNALKALLGPQQFTKYKAKVKPKVKDHFEFVEAAFEALGTSLGE